MTINKSFECYKFIQALFIFAYLSNKPYRMCQRYETAHGRSRER